MSFPDTARVSPLLFRRIENVSSFVPLRQRTRQRPPTCSASAWCRLQDTSFAGSIPAGPNLFSMRNTIVSPSDLCFYIDSSSAKCLRSYHNYRSPSDYCYFVNSSSISHVRLQSPPCIIASSSVPLRHLSSHMVTQINCYQYSSLYLSRLLNCVLFL